MRDALARIRSELGHRAGAGRHRAAERLHALPRAARAALSAAAILVVLAVVALAAAPALPCQLPGGDRCAPPDEAVALIPPDALLYARASVDPEHQQARELRDLVGRLATDETRASLAGLTAAFFPGLDADAEAALGDEFAFALLDGGEPVVLIEVAATGAEDAEPGLAWPVTAEDEVAGFTVLEYEDRERSAASAVIDGFMVIGGGRTVRSIAEFAASGAPALDREAAFSEALDAIPAERAGEIWIGPAGIEELVARFEGDLSQLEPFIGGEASRAFAAAIGVEDETLAIEGRSLLDEAADPPLLAGLPEFRFELANQLSASTLGLIGIGDLGGSASELLERSAAEAPDLAQGFTALAERLRRAAGLDLEADLLGALRGPGALAVGGAGEAGVATRLYVEALVTGVDEAAARDALARLQGPIARALAPRSSAPGFGQREFEGATVYTLALSPVTELAYTVTGGGAAIATDAAAIEGTISGDDPLVFDPVFSRSFDGLPEEAGLYAFLDLTGLIALGEANGLGGDRAYAAIAPALDSLEGLAVAVTGSESELATSVRLSFTGEGR